MLEEACIVVAARHPDVCVQVDLSAIELEHPDLLEPITGVLERNRIAPGRLVLEVTETLLVKDAEREHQGAAAAARPRRAACLGGFGTGYSWLSYLRNLPLDTLVAAISSRAWPSATTTRRSCA